MFSKTHYKRVIELLSQVDVTDEAYMRLCNLFKVFFKEDSREFSEEKWDFYVQKMRREEV